MNRFNQLVLAAMLLLFFGTSAIAGTLVLKVTAKKETEVVTPDGKKVIQYVDVDSVVPGNVLLYSINYHNQGAEKAEAVVIANPIPEHMVYVPGSAQGAGTIVRFSVDNGKTFDVPEHLIIVENGKTRPATAADYTNIQWSFKKDVSPDGKGSVEYRARLK